MTIARALSNTFAGIAPAGVPAFIVAQLLGAGLGLVMAERVFGWARTPEEKPTLAPAEERQRATA